MNWPTPAQGPGSLPPPRNHLQCGVPGRSQCRARTWALGAWHPPSAGHGGRLLGCVVLGEEWRLGPAETASSEVTSPGPSSQDLPGEELGRGDALCRFGGSEEEHLMSR